MSTGRPRTVVGHALARALTLAIGMVAAASSAEARGGSTEAEHAAVCRCVRCRDADRCCCVRAARESKGVEVEAAATARREERLAGGGCDAPGPGATSPRILSETPLVGAVFRGVGLAGARASGPGDDMVHRGVTPPGVERPPR